MRKKKEKVNTTFRSLKKLLGRYKYIYLIVILLCVITAVITSLSPYLIGLITTSIFNSITKGLSINSKYIFTILIICSVLYIISAIFMYLKSYLSSIIGIKISYNLREKFIEKINHID
ncbi:MAG: ABC transporter transmembrane domain-containing protein, partial [Bacilli bacterium]